MPSCPSHVDSEGEGQFQHGNGVIEKSISPPSLLHPPLLSYCVMIDAEAIQYRSQPTEPLTEMALIPNLQERSGGE